MCPLESEQPTGEDIEQKQARRNLNDLHQPTNRSSILTLHLAAHGLALIARHGNSRYRNEPDGQIRVAVADQYTEDDEKAEAAQYPWKILQRDFAIAGPLTRSHTLGIGET